MKRCDSQHRPGARWFAGEDRTVECELTSGHHHWHRRDGFEWDDEHALSEQERSSSEREPNG